MTKPPVGSLEIRRLVSEYGDVMKRLCRLERDETPLMQAVAASYRTPQGQKAAEARYGAGAGECFALAIEAMFGKTAKAKER